MPLPVLLDVADGALVPVFVEPVVLVLPGVDVAGATLRSEATVDHVAALLAAALFCWYGRKETTPVLSSWTKEVIPAKYVALGSLTLGAGSAAVVFVCGFGQ